MNGVHPRTVKLQTTVDIDVYRAISRVEHTLTGPIDERTVFLLVISNPAET